MAGWRLGSWLVCHTDGSLSSSAAIGIAKSTHTIVLHANSSAEKEFKQTWEGEQSQAEPAVLLAELLALLGSPCLLPISLISSPMLFILPC